MIKPTTKNTDPIVAARERNIAPKIVSAMSGIRSAGSDKLSMKTAIVTKIASTAAMPVISAVSTVETASCRDRNRQ